MDMIMTSGQLYQELKQAISGTKQDLTSGSLKRAVFLLSVPLVLEMLMESVFCVVDIYYVSRLGEDAVAAVGITESMITLIYAIAVGFSVATGAMVSRRIGEKKPEKAAEVASQSILTGIVISLLIAVPGCVFASQLLKVMGANSNIVESMYGYAAMMFGGNIVIMLLFIINAVFRSAGDAAISMRVLWMANIINLVLDPILIFGIGPFPEMGVTGAAVATNIGRGLAVLYQLHILFSGNARITLRQQNITIHLDTIKQLIKLSLGGIGQQIIATSSWVILMKIVSEFGSTVVAGYTIAIRIIVFVLLPCWGISNAAAALVGQNLGAQKPDRAEQSVWITMKINMIIIGTITLFLILFPRGFIQLFITDMDVIRKGAIALQVISLGFLAYGANMVLVQALNGAGDTQTPTKINLVCFWIIELPVAYGLAIMLGYEERGVFYAIIVADTLAMLCALFFFKRGKWKLKEV